MSSVTTPESVARRTVEKRSTPRFRMPAYVNGRTGTEHALMAEFVLALAILGLRAIADYVPASDQSQPGTEQPSKGAHPLTLLSALLAVFFVLSLGARGSGIMSRACVLFGGLLDLTLLINSSSELQTVSGWFDAMGSSKSQPAAAPTTSPGSGDDSGTQSSNPRQTSPTILH